MDNNRLTKSKSSLSHAVSPTRKTVVAAGDKKMAGKQQLKPLGIIASSKSTPPPPKHQERNNNHNPQQDPTLNKIALSPSSSYSSDVIVDGVLTPMLGRMTPSALHQVFNTEIAHCMKAFTAYSKLQDPSQRTNIRRRLLVQQFRKCIDKFRPYFSAHYFTLVMVESGEKVLGLSGFHDVAKLICFQEINNINNNNNKSVGSGGTVVESINHETVAKAAELDSISSPRHHHHQRSHYSKAVSEPKNSLQCLKYRSAFGSLLCDYLNSLAGDPWIRSTQSRAIVHRVLKCLCEDMEKLINEESLASIVLDATCHVYQIVVEMGACGMWSECLEPIQSATRSLEKCVHLNEPQYMYGWRTDVVLLYYKCLVKLEKFNEAEELILKTVEDIYLISALEKKVAVNEQISPIRLLAIENSLHRLNLVLFGCEIRGMGQGRKISADPLNKIGWELSKLRKSSTPIKAKRDRPVWFDAAALTSGGSINATDAGGAPFPAHPEMPSRRHSIISLSRSDKIASPKGAKQKLGMEHINKISFAILSQLSKTYNPDFSQLLNKDALGGSLESLADKGGDGTAAATEEDDIVAVAEEEVEEFNEVDNSTNSLSTPAEELTTKKKMAAGNKRVVMTKQMLAQAHAESEEKKLSLLIIQNICMMISLFETPMDRLNSVIEGLSNLIKTDISLRFIDKQLEKVNRKVFLTLRLLDIGYILLTTGFQISLTDNGMQKIFDKFSTLKKMVTSDDVNYLATLGVFDTYSISDAMQLSRMLFEYREWDRFHAIATLMQHHFVTLEQNDIVQGYSREVALRLAVIHFEVLHHSERKVGFGTDVGGNFGTQSDIRSRRFDISLNAHMTVVTLLHTLTGCMESNYLKAESPRLFMDAAIILWRFVEPFLRDLHFLSDAKDYSSLSSDNTIILVLRALHILHTEFATENILQGIVASSKLAMLFEILELYSDAELVLEETVARVRICREHLAEGTESIDSVTCSLNMHREFSEVSDLASLSHRQKNQSSLITLNTRRPLSSSKGGNNSSSSSPDSHSSEINQCSSLPYLHTHGIDASFLLNKLPCCELDLIAALVRCNMKQRYHTNVARQLKSDREFERLTNKKAPVTIVVARPIDEDVQRICASSLPSKAILNCTYAVSGKNIPLEERFVMLKQAYDLIQHESQNEKLLLRELQATLSDLNPTTSSASTAATICSTSKYPAPTFLRRTFHSITVNVKKDQDVAAMYQIFAHKFQLSKVGVNDIILDGTGEFSLMEAGEMTVSGLKPNEKYSIAAAAFNKTRKMIGKGIGVTSDPILAALPLHLLQCWGYLANAAHSIGCHQIAEKAHLQLESIFVNSKASDSSLLELASHVSCVVSISAEASSSLYTLHEKSVCAEPSACIRGYIQSIQFKNEFGTKAADASMFSDSQGSHPSIGAQLVRLRACLDYLIAAELAERISDPELVVLLLADCYQYLEPLIQLGYPSVFVVNGLMACHQGMLKHSAHLDNDRSQYLARFFIPATYYLTSFMLKLGQLKSLIHISLISLELITKACNVGDLVISNSPNFETQLIGKATKKNASLNPIKKGEISYYSDFNYNAVLATSKDWRKGIPQSHPRGVDLFCEHLETLIAICTGQNALTRSLIIVDQKGSETLKLVLRVNPGLASVFDSGLSGVVNAANAVTTSNFTKEKKTLDANTSLKDFYTIIQTSGAEAVSQQLSSAFSKNPRYLELMTRCAAWAVMHQQFDLAVRICLEISEWIDIRNALVVTGEFVVNKLELKRQILLKRRRKSIFIDKNNMPFHEEDRQTRSKNKKIKTKGANIQKSSEHQYHHNLDDHSKLDITLRPNEPKTAQSPQPPVQPNHDEEGREGDDVYTREEIEFAGGDNQESGSNSRSGSRGSTRSRSQSADRGKDYNRQHQQQDLHDFEVADQEQSKRTKKKEKSRSKSPKTAKSLTKLNSNNSNAVAIIADRKRHKITQRSLFFNGMSVAEKDMYERHLFVLDNLLSAVWRQSRYRRRIRAIIKIENDWRARMAHVRGFGLLRILEKDVLQSRSRSESTTLGIDSDWFTLGVNGHVHISSQKNSRVLLHEQQQQPAAISSHPAPADTSSNSKNANSKNQANSPTVVIPELLQSFVQSITLSGRAHSWHQVLESSTELLNSLKFISRNQLAVSENWNSHLWRGLFIAGDVLMDMLESIQFRRASHSEIEGFQSNPRVPVISSLDKMPFFGEGASARENTAPGGQYGYFRLGHHAPFSSIEQLKQGLFVGEWVNSQHFQQQMVVDFSWCTEFLTLAVEAMASAKKNHRLLEFSHRFNYIFKDIFSPILYPIIHHSVKKTENSQMKMVDSILKGPSMTASSWYLLMRCRESFSVYLESRLIRSSSVATSSNAEKESKLLQISINSYENAIKSMELAYDQTESPDTKLALAYANNEYGDVLVESGDSMSAAVFWSKASDLMFESYQSIPKHIKLMETSPCNSQEVAFTLIKAAGGAQKSLIAANIVSKMARYSYASNLEKRMQLVRLATALFTSPLYSTLPHPHSEEAFCDYKPPYIMPILEKISFDKFQLNPGSMFEMMLFLSNQWINFTDIPLSAFPLLSMAEYLAEDLCSSSDMKTSVLLLKSEAFAKTKRFSNALSILESVSLGGGLVFKDAQLVFSMNSNSIISDQAPQSAVRPIFYQNDRPLRKEQNMQALKSAHGLTFSEKLKAVMTSSNLIEFEVTKSKVVLLIIESGHVAQDSYFLEKLPLSSSLFNNNYNNSNNNDLPSSDHLNLLSRLSIDASLESNSILSSLAQAVSLKNLETTSSSTNTQKQRPPSSSNQAHSVYESLKNIPASEPLVASGDKSGSSGYANEELDDAQIALRNNEIIQGVFKRIKHTLTQRLSDVKSFVTLSKSFLSGDFSSSEEDSSTIEMKHITTSKKRRYLSSLLQISLILAKISLLRGRNQEAAESLLDIQNYIKSDSLLQEYGFENWLSLSEQLGESWYNIGRFEEALKIATDSYVDARKVSSTIYQLRFSVLAVKAKESLNMSKSRMSMESIENMLIIKSCIESLSRHEFFVPGLVLKSILEILNLYSFSPVIAARDNCFEVFSNWSPISSSLRLMEKMEKSLHPSSTLVLRTALIEKRLQILVQKAIYDRMEGRIFESFSNFKSTIRPFFSKTVLELSRSSIVMEALFQEAQSAFCSSRILQKDQSDEAIEQAKVNIDCISDIISATGCFDLPFAFRALSLMLLIIASNKEDSEVKNKTIARISTSLTSCVSILGGTGAQFGDFNYQGLKGLKRITIDEKNDLLEDVLLVYKSKISTAAPPMTTTAGLRKNSKSAYMNSSSMILNNNVGGLDPLPPGKQQEDIHLKLLTKETISSYISETLVGARYCGPIHLEDSQTSESWKRAIRLLKVLSRSFPSKFNPCLAGMWRTNFSDDSNLSKMSAKVPNSLLWVPVQMGKEERTLLIIKNSRPSSATGVGSAKDSPSSTTSNGSAGGAGKNKSAKGSSASVSGGSKAPTAPSSASNKEKNNAASSSASSSSTSNSSTSQASKQSIQVYFAEFSETWIRSAANSLEYIRSSSGREFEVDQRNNATLEFCTVFFKALESDGKRPGTASEDGNADLYQALLAPSSPLLDSLIQVFRQLPMTVPTPCDNATALVDWILNTATSRNF